MWTSISTEKEVALSDFSASIGSVNLTLRCSTEIMRRKLPLHTCLVIHCMTTESIVWHSIRSNTVLLGKDLRFVNLFDSRSVMLICNKFVVFGSGSAITSLLLEADLEIGNAHRQWIANISDILHCEFVWSESMGCRCHIGELLRSIRLTERKVRVAALKHELCVDPLRLSHILSLQRVLLLLLVEVLRR